MPPEPPLIHTITFSVFILFVYLFVLGWGVDLVSAVFPGTIRLPFVGLRKSDPDLHKIIHPSGDVPVYLLYKLTVSAVTSY